MCVPPARGSLHWAAGGGAQRQEGSLHGVGPAGRLGPPPAHVAHQQVLRAQDCHVLCLA